MVAAIAPLVGRDGYLDLLSRWLDGTANGRGAAVVLAGEAGIGKTRLAEELATIARARGFVVAWSTSWQGEGVPALWPWVGLLRQIAGEASVLEQVARTGHDDAEAARFAQFAAVAELIKDAAAQHPLMLVIDDLHWADLGSLRLFGLLAAELRSSACLLVGTMRPDETATEGKELLARHCSVLPVTGLDEEAVRAMVADSVPGFDSRMLANTVLERSGGNPLFAVELTRLIVASGRVELAASAVPVGVVPVIERRLAGVAEADLPVLRALALLGRTASLADAATVSELPDAVVARTAEEAIRVGLLEPTSADVRFTHDLVRDVVLASVPIAERAALHLRAANVFERRAAIDPSWHAVAADHLEAAGNEHRPDAARHWELAGDRALAMLAYDDGASCYARAAAGVGHDAHERLRLALREAEALLLAGHLLTARDRFAEATDLARNLDDPVQLAVAALGVNTSVASWEVPISDSRHVAVVREALERLPKSERRLRALLLARASVAGSSPDTMVESEELADEALAVALELGDPSVVATALAAVNDARAGPDHVQLRHDNALQMIDLAIEAGDTALALLGRRFLLAALAEQGDFSEFDRQLGSFDRDAALLRQPLVGWYVALFRGMRALMRGDLTVAGTAQVDVARAADETGSINARMLAMTLGIGIDAATNTCRDYDFIALNLVDAAVWPSLAAGVAMIGVMEQDRAKAAQFLHYHSGDKFASMNRDAEYLTSLTVFGRAAVFVGDADAAAALVERMAPYTHLWAIDGINAHCWGPIDAELGRLHAFLGNTEAANEHLERARDALIAVRAPLLRADVERLLGAGPTAEAPASGGIGDEFVREGEFWTVAFDGTTVRVKDAKGMHDLARLIAVAGREVHVSELAGVRVEQAAIDVLDPRARDEYRQRLRDLDDDLAEAEALADSGRAEKARIERDFLIAELAGAVGLHGRSRKVGGPNERARKAVSLRIHQTIDRIGDMHPALGRHLANSVRTGLYCSYQPESARFWRV